MAQPARRSRVAFAALYDQLVSMVYGIAINAARTSDEAESITVDTFVAVWRNAARVGSAADVRRIATAVALRTTFSSP